MISVPVVLGLWEHKKKNKKQQVWSKVGTERGTRGTDTSSAFKGIVQVVIKTGNKIKPGRES